MKKSTHEAKSTRAKVHISSSTHQSKLTCCEYTWITVVRVVWRGKTRPVTFLFISLVFVSRLFLDFYIFMQPTLSHLSNMTAILVCHKWMNKWCDKLSFWSKDYEKSFEFIVWKLTPLKNVWLSGSKIDLLTIRGGTSPESSNRLEF